jgi:hypothetical protein
VHQSNHKFPSFLPESHHEIVEPIKLRLFQTDFSWNLISFTSHSISIPTIHRQIQATKSFNSVHKQPQQSASETQMREEQPQINRIQIKP